MIRPAWAAALPDVVRVHAMTWRVGSVPALHLPPMQRPIVWTPAQQIALVQSLWSGLPMPPLVMWEHGRRLWLLDGQQRATAIGCDVRDADGQRRPAPLTRWDPLSGAWSLGMGEPLTLADVADVDRVTVEMVADDPLQAHRVCGMARATSLDVPALVIRSWDDATVPRVLDAFRALATPGVPWPDGEAEAMVAGCAGWAP